MESALLSLGGGLLGLALGGAFLVSIGLYFSSVTDNQIIAAIASMGTSLLFWVLGWIGRYLPSGFAGLVGAFSLHDRLLDAFRGVLNTGDIVFFLAFILAVLSLTGIKLSRKAAVVLLHGFLLLASAFVAQDLGSRLVVRFDLTEKKIHSLAPITKKALSELDGSPLGVTVFMEDDEEGRSELEALLGMYKAEYPGLRPAFHSPSRNPAMVQRYGIGSHGVLVLRYRDQDLKVAGYDEEALTGGILKLLHPRSPAVYFLSGHGEKTPSRGLRARSLRLEALGYRIGELTLQKPPSMPEDAACLVVAGPRETLLGPELGLVQDFLRRGGSLLLLLDPYNDGGFAPYLSSLGIGLAQDAVVDEGGRLFRGDSLFPRAASYPSHEITRALDRVAMFPVARHLSLDPRKNDEVDLAPIALSSNKAWAETDRASLSAEKPVFDPATDKAGPLALAAAAKLKAEDPKFDGRIVVVGDSDFATDAYLSFAGNEEFFLDTLAWLADSEEKIGLVLREPGHHPIVLSERQVLITGLVALVLVPGMFAFMGVRVLLRRRKET